MPLFWSGLAVFTYGVLLYWVKCGGSVAAEEAGKAHYVAAGQAGGKESVEPAYAGCDYLYHVAYVDHREEVAGTYHLPLP